jgi:MoxR-like ATPase
MGIGKSAAFRRIAEKLNIQIIDMRLTQMDAVDLRGLPIISEDGTKTTWATPKELPTEGKGILFLDELNLAPPSVQHAAYQLILLRKLGNYHLPEGWVAMAAGNRPEDRAHVNQMPAPLNNRFVHIHMDPPPIDDWFKWALENDIDERVLGFLKSQPEWLFRFESDNSSAAFPTPRSWEMFSKLSKELTNLDTLRECGEMSVGKRAAGELLAFIEIFSKIDAAVILNTKNYQFPTDLGKLTATMTALAIHAKRSRLPTQVKFLNLLARKDLAPEFSVLGVQLSFSRSQLVELLQKTTKKDDKLLDRLVLKLKGYLEWE